MAGRTPPWITAMLVGSMLCSAAAIYALTLRPVPGWTGTLNTVSILLVLMSTVMLRRKTGGREP